MKNANPSTTTILRYVLPMLAILLVVTKHNALAQLSTCNSDTTIANFGVNRAVYKQGFSTVDDWFIPANDSGTGQGVIGMTAQTAKPPLQISATDFKNLITGALSVTGRNRTYVQGMAVPSLTVWNNMLLVDAFAARDNISSSGANDSTVFSGGGDKNADNPNTWAIGVGGVQQKSDIVDVAGHLRRDLNTGDLWCFTMASILAPGGDNFIDFEFYRTSLAIVGGMLTNTGLASAGNHTPFLLNSNGGIQSPGDVLVGLSYSLSAGSASMRIWINPNDVDGAGHDTAWFNQLPNRFFTFTGGCVFGLNSGSFGYAEIRSKTPASCLVNSVVNSSLTPSGEWGTLGGSSAAYSANYVSEQLVEVAINFSDFGLDLNTLSGACFNVFGSLLVKTRSSSSLTSELKDFAGPFQFGNLTEVQAAAGSDMIINCASTVVTLNSSSMTPGAIPAWSTQDGQIVVGANTFNPTISRPGTYILTVSSPSIATCTTTDTVVVTIDTIAPQASAGSDWTFDCNADAIRTLNGSSPNPVATPIWTAIGTGSVISDAATFNPVVSSNGCYVLTVTNPSNLCASNDTVCAAVQTDVPVITASQIVQPSCNASCNASISLNLSGAPGPFAFVWSDGHTGQNRSGLCEGTYEVTVTSTNGCTAVYSTSLTAPAELVASSGSSIVPVSCNGGNDGSISISASGGTAPYTGIGTFNGLSAGTYTYTVVDANGCTFDLAFQIDQPIATLSATALTVDVDCNTNASGQIDLQTSGGTAPYIFQWSNGSVNEDQNNLTAGTYDVLITDANGCTFNQSILVNQPALAISAGTNSVDVDCNASASGSIDLTVNGGTSPYVFQWSNGSNAEDQTGLTAGLYSVLITDANNCQFTATASVNEPALALSATNSTTNVLCQGDVSGGIDITAVGGTAPYSYQWNNGSTNEDQIGLAAGSYDVIITDNNGCTFQSSYTITEPIAALVSSNTVVNVDCNGNTSGQIDLSVAGGTAPYSFQWSNGSTTEDQPALGAGTYTVLITDANNCTSSVSVTINEPTAVLSASSSVNAVGCNGGNSGQIDLTAVGGSSPYSFTWSNGSTTEDLSGLNAGTYTVTVSDVNGCTTVHVVQITQPQNALQTNGTTTAADCIGGTLGTASVSPTGGTAPFTYQWANGTNAPQLTNLIPGNYAVIVTDANGCTANQTLTVGDNTSLTIQATGATEICVGDSATISAPVVANATYQWMLNGSPLQGANTNSFTTPVNGSYQVVVTTSCGPYTSNPVNITLRTVDNVSITNNVIICTGETTQFQVTGGTTYSWSPSTNLDNATIPNPVASPRTTTTYVVTIEDDYGCKTTASVTVTVECDTLNIPNGFSPNGDGKNDTFVIDGLEQFPGTVVTIFNRWGNMVYKQKDYANDWNGTSNVGGTVGGNELPNGTYYYIIDLNKGEKPLSGFVVIRR